MPSLIFDIETGPLPWETIAPMYVPPPAMSPWDDSMVKYGNCKDPAKRQEKYAQVKSAYMAELAAESQKIEADRCQWASEAALSPVTGQILAIGIRRDSNVCIVGENESEAEILDAFWTVYQKYAAAGHLIGFCSNVFDVPFIIWRSYVHQIEVPESVWDRNPKYLAKCFVDLADRIPRRGLPADEDGKKRGLSNVCRLLGLGTKPDGVNGGDFARLWTGSEENRQMALAYLENDLELTWRLAERMGVV